MTTTISYEFRIANTLTTPDDIYFHLPVVREDTGEEIVPADTLLEEVSKGVYAYTFTDPEYNLVYSYGIEIEYAGEVYQYEGYINGSVGTSYETYVDIDYADKYFQTRLFVDPWNVATLEDKQKSLIMATRAIDRLPLRRSRADPDQYLAFPRFGQDEVPIDVEICCCEEALSLLAGNDPVEEAEMLGIIGEGFSGVRTTYDPERICLWKEYGFTSKKAFDYIYPYLDNLVTFRIDRV